MASPAKLPYGGINRVRFDGSVSTTAIGPRYPRFIHLLEHAVITRASLMAGQKEAALEPGGFFSAEQLDQLLVYQPAQYLYPLRLR